MSAAPLYICPMHTDVKASEASKCPRCGMIGMMIAAMLVLMAAAMMMMR